MLTKIWLGTCAAAEAFMVYVLYHFGREGRRHRPAHPVTIINSAERGYKSERPESKAA